MPSDPQGTIVTFDDVEPGSVVTFDDVSAPVQTQTQPTPAPQNAIPPIQVPTRKRLRVVQPTPPEYGGGLGDYLSGAGGGLSYAREARRQAVQQQQRDFEAAIRSGRGMSGYLASTRLAEFPRTEFVTEPEPYQAAAAKPEIVSKFGQIKFTELPADQLSQLGFGRDLFEASRNLIAKLYGPEAAQTVAKIDVPQPDRPRVRGEPVETLEPYYVFKPTPDAPYQTIWNPTKMATLGGVGMAAAQSIPMVTGTIGGVGATLAAPQFPIAATAIGTGVGSFLGEYARLSQGKALGIVDQDADIASEAASRAGWDALFSFGGQLALNVVLRYARGGVPNLGMAVKEIEDLIRSGQVRLRTAETAANIPEGTLQATAGQLLAPSASRGAMLAEMESQASRGGGPAGSLLRGRYEEIEAGKRALQSSPQVLGSEFETTTLLGVRPSPSQLGQRISQVAGGTPAEVQAIIERNAVRGRPPGIPLTDPFIDPTNASANVSIRKGIENAEEAAYALSTQILASVRAKYSSLLGEASTARKIALEEQVRQSLNRIPSLDQADARLIDDFLANAKARGGYEMSLEEMQITLQALRRAERAALGASGGEMTPNAVTISRLEDALSADRDEILRKAGGDTLVTQIRNAESGYRAVKDIYRRSVLRNFIGTTSKGGDIIGDLSIGNRILSNPEAALAVSNVLTTGKYPAERELIRSMLRFRIAEEAGVLDARGATSINAEAMDKIINKYTRNQVLPMFFTQAEIDGMRRISGWASGMRRLFGVENLKDTSKWFDDFWNAGNPEQAMQMMRRLERYDQANPGQGMADTVRAYLRNRLASEITDAPRIAGNPAMINKDKLFNFLLADPRRIEWINAVVDPQFANRLNVVQRALLTLEPRGASVALSEAEKAGGQEAGRLQAFKRLAFGTLNRTAAFINNQINNISPTLQARFARAVADPEYFLELVKNGERTVGKSATYNLLAVGASEHGAINTRMNPERVDVFGRQGTPIEAARRMTQEIMQ